MRAGKIEILLAVALVMSPAISVAQDHVAPVQPTPVVLSATILDRIVPAYRDEAKSLVTVTEENQQRWTKLSDEDLTANVIGQLSRNPAASDFLLGRLENEQSAKLRSAIMRGLSDYWTKHPEQQKILEQHASSDSSAVVALQALELLRSIRTNNLGKLLQVRLDVAKSSQDTLGFAKLAEEHERHYSWFGDIALPSFLKVPPPLFSVQSPDQTIRVLAFGDFGFGSEAQKKTAAAMVEYNNKNRFDFGITLGDNFYTYGMDGTSDPRWQTQWEDLYGPLGIKFYPSFGNHDYGQRDSPAAEILYSEKSPDWRFPAPYYTFTAGTVQFFAIDTVDLSEAELLWLDSEIAKSRATWKVVYGHYPIYSATGEDKQLGDRLLPVLKERVDVYLTGHHHNLQELKPEAGVHFFVSGGGGAPLYDMKSYDRSIFKDKVNGFTVLEADADHLKISFVGTDGKEIYHQVLQKGTAGQSYNWPTSFPSVDQFAGFQAANWISFWAVGAAFKDDHKTAF